MDRGCSGGIGPRVAGRFPWCSTLGNCVEQSVCCRTSQGIGYFLRESYNRLRSYYLFGDSPLDASDFLNTF